MSLTILYRLTGILVLDDRFAGGFVLIYLQLPYEVLKCKVSMLRKDKEKNMKTLIAGSNGMASVVPARGGGVRDWQRWAPYAAVAWSVIYAALGVWARAGGASLTPPKPPPTRWGRCLDGSDWVRLGSS